MRVNKILILIGLLFFAWVSNAQNSGSENRFIEIENKLEVLSASVKGLNEKIDLSVTGISIQEFLRGLAESNNLNVSVDPRLNIRVYNNFNDVEAKSILLFLCKEYDLEIRFLGSIMSFYKYQAPIPEAVYVAPKSIDLKYNRTNDLVSLNLRNDTLFKVLKAITVESNKNVISAPDVSNDLLLNAYIQNMPFANAIEKMAFANNLELEVTKDSFFVLKNKPKEIIATSDSKNGRNSRSGSSTRKNGSRRASESSGDFDLLVKDSLGSRLITFSTLNMNISDVIREVSAETKMNYYMFNEPSGSVNLTVTDVPYDEFLEYVLLGSDFTYRIDEGVYLIGERKAEGLRTTKVVQMMYRTYSDIQEAIPSELKQGVEIQEFPELNSFVLSGSTPQIKEIETLVDTLDQVVPLVMIEVILVDIRKGSDLRTGVTAGFADTVTTGGTLLSGLDMILSSSTLNRFLSPLNLGRVNKNFYLAIEAVDEQNFADVKSMPKLATLNGHEANMTIGETRYYLTETQNVVGGLNPNTIVTPQWNSVEANLAINITPQVSGDEHVTLDISIEVSDFVGDPPANAPPPSTTRQFTSLIRVKDHEMILLGGMERESKSESGRGIPVLNRIPIIKWFFSRKAKSKGKTVSFVFIKPTIIY